MTATDDPFGQLPVSRALRLEHMAEEVRYVARPGLAALPTGTGTVLLFLSPQVFSVSVLLWAIWWPTPQSWRTIAFAMFWTSIIAALAIGVAWMLLRRHPGFMLGLLRAPFIRLTVTDRRVVWTLPWERAPLLEIDRRRVTGGILGTVDRRGRGNAAMMLVPGDPSADIDGNIHFDRLPHVARFVAALGQTE
ncbi:MAG: hypothetical protein JWL91_2689 [Sphingomonas bacterium]|nr:hypothetical protein [Sphingomonas bacterium]MDB5690813.1 hypothetical protein [Sphingomonas bacterium]